ncbi:MAG: ArnT family glycosyltransferase [bacterium]
MVITTAENKNKKARKSKKHKHKSATHRSGQFLNTQSVFWILFILSICVISYINIFDQKLDLNGDNVGYYLLGKALAKGEGFVNIWNAEKPPSNHFPPGYPTIISLIMFIISDNVITIKIANGLFFFLSIVVLFLLFNRAQVEIKFTALTTLIIAVNSHLLRYASIMMSEIPYLFFTSLALYLTTKINFSKKPYKNILLLIIISCLAIAYYIRTIGIAAVFGIIFYFILRKKWLYVLYTGISFMVLVIPWFIRGQILGGNPYLNQLIMVNPYDSTLGFVGIVDIFKRFLTNFLRYISIEIPNGCLPFLEKALYSKPLIGWSIGIAILGLFIYGIIKLKSYQTLFIGYLAGILGITFLWPEVWYGIRFIVGIIPFLTFFVFYGFYEFIKTILEKKHLSLKFSPLFLSPILLFYFFPLQQQHIKSQRTYPPNWMNYFRLANWVKQNTPSNTIVSCRKAEFFYLFSDRSVTVYAFTRDDQKLIQRLREQEVDYVVVDQLGYGSTPKYLVPAIQKNPNKFRVVIHLKNPDTYLLEFLN